MRAIGTHRSVGRIDIDLTKQARRQMPETEPAPGSGRARIDRIGDEDMKNFSVETEYISLPHAATPRARRTKVGWRGRAIAVLAQGDYRAYLYPVYTPQGVAVTDESPRDHPHHNSITVGSDHINCHFPPLLPEMTSLVEYGNYNLYVNDTFQGRSPGRVVATTTESTEVAEDHLRVVQSLQWQGPIEWAAPERRNLADETRTIDIYPGDKANIIDLRSQLRPTEWDLSIGPTRHAYFTIRLAEGLREIDGGTSSDSEGRNGAARISGNKADWIDGSGPAPHGKNAGIAVFKFASAGDVPWHIFDWGTINLNPIFDDTWHIKRGAEVDIAIRIVVHDGDASEAGVAEIYEASRSALLGDF